MKGRAMSRKRYLNSEGNDVTKDEFMAIARKHILVDGREFNLQVMDSAWKKDTNLHGRINYDDRIIKIAEDSDSTEAILHEALHYMSYACGWNIKEGIIVSMGIKLADLIKNNPQFDFRKGLKEQGVTQDESNH